MGQAPDWRCMLRGWTSFKIAAWIRGPQQQQLCRIERNAEQCLRASCRFPSIDCHRLLGAAMAHHSETAAWSFSAWQDNYSFWTQKNREVPHWASLCANLSFLVSQRESLLEGAKLVTCTRQNSVVYKLTTSDILHGTLWEHATHCQQFSRHISKKAQFLCDPRSTLWVPTVQELDVLQPASSGATTAELRFVARGILEALLQDWCVTDCVWCWGIL